MAANGRIWVHQIMRDNQFKSERFSLTIRIALGTLLGCREHLASKLAASSCIPFVGRAFPFELGWAPIEGAYPVVLIYGMSKSDVKELTDRPVAVR